MIVENGEFYEDANGKKQGPVYRIGVSWTYESSTGTFMNDGKSLGGLDPDLIRKWVEPDTPPIFEDMTDAEKGALLLADHRGKRIECWTGTEWIKKAHGGFGNVCSYRIAPTRIHGSVETDADGSPDFSTWEADQ